MENKYHENSRVCVCIHAYAHACSSSTYACFMHAYANFMHAYAYTGMHTYVRVLEIMKGKFSALKFGFWNESHIVWEPFQTPNFEL